MVLGEYQDMLLKNKAVVGINNSIVALDIFSTLNEQWPAPLEKEVTTFEVRIKLPFNNLNINIVNCVTIF